MEVVNSKKKIKINVIFVVSRLKQIENSILIDHCFMQPTKSGSFSDPGLENSGTRKIV